MVDENQVKSLLSQHIQRLVTSEWTILEDEWHIVQLKKGHRSEIKDIHNVQHIKMEIGSKIGYIGPFIFLNDFYSRKDWIGPYRNVEKGLLLIYHLLSGKSNTEMSIHLPKSSFQDILNELYVKEYDTLNSWLDYCVENMFSNMNIRILSAALYNTQEFKNVTMFIDGRDSRINYSSCKEIESFRRGSLYSFKLKQAGCRTQIMSDVNNMIIGLSETDKCGEKTMVRCWLNGNLIIWLEIKM
jgi:hypothetical protein